MASLQFLRTLRFPSAQLILGEVVQSVSLGVVARGDVNTSFTTRAVGTILITLLFATGSIIASFATPFSAGIVLSALTVPIIRADVVLSLVSHLTQVFLWANKLQTSKILYLNEVFPLQVAAMVWNDCAPITPQNRSEDENTIILDVLRGQRQLWRPTRLDSVFTRALKMPVFLVIQLLCSMFSGVERIIFATWRILFDRGQRNRTPVLVQGEQREVIGHTALVSDAQLAWVQEFTMRANPESLPHNREARRVLLRALHIANLLEHGGFTRLPEHASSGYAMNQYFAAIRENNLVKSLLSKMNELKVLGTLPNGNKLDGGRTVPRQVLWARLIVGSLRGIHNEGRWRGPVAQALFTVAQQNYEAWGATNVSRTAVHRHVYSVTRRWFVDWMMFMWWDTDIPSELVNDVDAFFARLRRLLTSNLMHNTWSLPHALGELAISENRAADVNSILSLMLGPDWELWMEQCNVVSGTGLRQAMEVEGEWKCVGQEVTVDISISSALYKTMLVEAVIATDASASLADQARARIAERIVDTLARRLRDVWEQLPNRLFDPLDTTAPEDEM